LTYPYFSHKRAAIRTSSAEAATSRLLHQDSCPDQNKNDRSKYEEPSPVLRRMADRPDEVAAEQIR
jgi:hypothetical protein